MGAKDDRKTLPYTRHHLFERNFNCGSSPKPPGTNILKIFSDSLNYDLNSALESTGFVHIEAPEIRGFFVLLREQACRSQRYWLMVDIL